MSRNVDGYVTYHTSPSPPIFEGNHSDSDVGPWTLYILYVIRVLHKKTRKKNFTGLRKSVISHMFRVLEDVIELVLVGLWFT